MYYEFLFGNLPGIGKVDKDMIKYIIKNGIKYPYSIKTSQMSRDFIEGCL